MSAILREFIANEAAIKRLLARYFRKTQDVEDFAQEAFLRAYAAEAKRTILLPRAYLFRVAKHIALNELARRRTARTESLEDFPEPDVMGVDTQPGLEQEVSGRQQMALFARATASLPEQCRKVLLLKKIDGLSQREISQRLSIAESTVEKHLARGLLLVRDYMTKHETLPGPRDTTGRIKDTPAAPRRLRGDGE